MSVEAGGGGPWAQRKHRDQAGFRPSSPGGEYRAHSSGSSSSQCPAWDQLCQKGQWFIIRLLKAFQPISGDPRSVEVSHRLGARRTLSLSMPMPHFPQPLHQGEPQRSYPQLLAPASTPSRCVCPSPAGHAACIHLHAQISHCPGPSCLLPAMPLMRDRGLGGRQPEERAELWLLHPFSRLPYTHLGTQAAV